MLFLLLRRKLCARKIPSIVALTATTAIKDKQLKDCLKSVVTRARGICVQGNCSQVGIHASASRKRRQAQFVHGLNIKRLFSAN